MRTGNFAEFLQAGMQKYFQMKQWSGQMEQSELEKERSKLASQMYQKQLGGYETPAQQRKAAYGAWQRRGGETPAEQRTAEFEQQKKIADYRASLQPTAVPGERERGSEYKRKEAFDILSTNLSIMGITNLDEEPRVSPAVLTKAIDLLQAGLEGEALSLVALDKLSKEPDLEWLGEIEDTEKHNFATEAATLIQYLVSRNTPVDTIKQQLKDLSNSWEDRGLIEHIETPIETIVRRAREKIVSIAAPTEWKVREPREY